MKQKTSANSNILFKKAPIIFTVLVVLLLFLLINGLYWLNNNYKLDYIPSKASNNLNIISEQNPATIHAVSIESFQATQTPKSYNIEWHCTHPNALGKLYPNIAEEAPSNSGIRRVADPRSGTSATFTAKCTLDDQTVEAYETIIGTGGGNSLKNR